MARAKERPVKSQSLKDQGKSRTINGDYTGILDPVAIP